MRKKMLISGMTLIIVVFAITMSINTITEIDAADAKGNGCIFFIKDNNTLILYGGGVYLELNKI
ncbi:MAG: hypothetical protein VB130_02655 [Clostridium sp.]|nr:hypothetical protein [Clostridium sp.]